MAVKSTFFNIDLDLEVDLLKEIKAKEFIEQPTPLLNAINDNAVERGKLRRTNVTRFIEENMEGPLDIKSYLEQDPEKIVLVSSQDHEKVDYILLERETKTANAVAFQFLPIEKMPQNAGQANNIVCMLEHVSDHLRDMQVASMELLLPCQSRSLADKGYKTAFFDDAFRKAEFAHRGEEDSQQVYQKFLPRRAY